MLKTAYLVFPWSKGFYLIAAEQRRPSVVKGRRMSLGKSGPLARGFLDGFKTVFNIGNVTMYPIFDFGNRIDLGVCVMLIAFCKAW